MNSLRKLPLGSLCNHFSSITSGYSKRSINANFFNSIRQYASYEGDGKTTANVLNMEQGLGLMVISHSPHGFRLNNRLFMRGPITLFPTTALSWYVHGIDDINEESLSIFRLLDPAVDLVVIGCGDKENMTKEQETRIRNIMRKFKIACEILPTDMACTTFNFLVAEDRFAAAALIPQIKGFDPAKSEHLQKMENEHGLLS